MNQGIVPDEVGKDHLNWDKCVDESLGYWNEEIPEFNGSNKMKVSFPLTEQSEKAKRFLLGKFICHSWHFPFQLLLLLVDGKVRELKVSVSVPCSKPRCGNGTYHSHSYWKYYWKAIICLYLGHRETTDFSCCPDIHVPRCNQRRRGQWVLVGNQKFLPYWEFRHDAESRESLLQVF